MDFSELTRIIFSRIQKLEPENAIKILGCLFLNEPDEQRMIQLAFGPDEEIRATIVAAKATLSVLSSKLFSAQSVPSHHHQFDDRNVHSQAQFLSLEEHMDRAHSTGPEIFSNYFYQEDGFGGGMTSMTSRRSPSLPEFSFKACHYFQKGYCKHGVNCRYFHGQSVPDMCTLNLNDVANEDQVVSPRSLEKLQMEITELLKEKRGVPVSIASLPVLYFEKYGRNLQAEGYLTEGQRHGKAGFSLTKLLARLKNSIQLIDRPHGQHSVILIEDARRYMAYRNENHDHGATAASSHQIYLTFPPDSTFTEEDVSNYFKQFGPVHDVRIPCQDKRMFGFVSFVHPETVRAILSKRNPHYISGARVLVKPYKEKSRIIDRANLEKIDPAMHYPHHLEMDPVLCAMQRESGRSRSLRWQQMEEQEKLAALERRHLSELTLSPKPHSQPPYFSNRLDDLEISEAPNEFLTVDHFSYPLDTLNNELQTDGKSKPSNDQGDQDSGQIDLPESPFASPTVGSSISGLL